MFIRIVACWSSCVRDSRSLFVAAIAGLQAPRQRPLLIASFLAARRMSTRCDFQSTLSAEMQPSPGELCT